MSSEDRLIAETRSRKATIPPGGAVEQRPPHSAPLTEEELIRQLRSKIKLLIATALDGSAPLLIAARELALDLPNKNSAAQLVRRLERAIEKLLSTQGFHRLREVNVKVYGINTNAGLYYRPAEEELFKAIEEPYPVLAAVTAEPQRFARAIIEKCGTAGMGRPVLIWTSASGLHEVEGTRSSAKYHQGQNPARIIAHSVMSLHRLSERLHTDAVDDPNTMYAVRASLVENEGYFPEQHILGLRAVQIFRTTAMLMDQAFKPQIHFDVFIDDLPDEGRDFQPLDEMEENDLLSQLRLEEGLVNATREWCRKTAESVDNFGAMINHIVENPIQDAIFLLFDGHHYLSTEAGPVSALHARALKDLFYRLRRQKQGIKVVIFSGNNTFPPDLRDELQRIELPLPSRRELEAELRREIFNRNLPTALLQRDASGYLTRLVDAAAGMTIGEVRTVIDRFARAEDTTTPSGLVEEMHEAKKNSVARSPALEVIDGHALPDTQLGGLDRLTAWLDSRKRIFEHPEAARAAGIDRRPKGVLLLGIPGTGKSLAAKVVARRWGLPLLRLDMGAVHHHFVGSSEARIRDALKTVTAMAPCVLWIDEIDKGIAQGEGTHSNSVDLNIRATLLTWMQEYQEPIFIIATANRISLLPPELMRAGRFDARFFLGCPGAAGREEIVRIHLRKRKIAEDSVDIGKLVDATHGFTGAEIEQLILDALYDAFNTDDSAKVTMKHLEDRVARIQPLIKTIGSRQGGDRPRGQLDDVWDLIDEGRVELASDDLLTRSQVARLVDPYLYRPVYCRKEKIDGFDKLQSKGERMVMSVPLGGPVAAVLDTGDPEWIYVHTNVRFDQLDQHDFKFLDRIQAIEDNGVFDTLVTQYGIEKIIFAESNTRQRLQTSDAIGQYSDLFSDPDAP